MFSCSQKLSNLLALCVPNEGYSRNAQCALNLISRLLNAKLAMLQLYHDQNKLIPRNDDDDDDDDDIRFVLDQHS